MEDDNNNNNNNTAATTTLSVVAPIKNTSPVKGRLVESKSVGKKARQNDKKQESKHQKKRKAKGNFWAELTNKQCQIHYRFSNDKMCWVTATVLTHTVSHGKHWHRVHFQDRQCNQKLLWWVCRRLFMSCAQLHICRMYDQ
jgi:hypothetical protein